MNQPIKKTQSKEELILLIVDDHPFQRRMIKQGLRTLGIRRILEAANGKDALKLIEEEAQPNVIISDLDMPEIDGLALIRYLGEAKSSAAVIISSAKEHSLLASVKKLAHFYGINLIGVIKKPLTPDLIDELLLKYCDMKMEQSPITQNEFSDLDQILRGIEHKHFEPFFQPQIEIATDRIVGAEALARWHHPELGLLAPHTFISALEQSGNIDKLTMLMLEKAAIACRRWRKLGFDMSVSINLSLCSLEDANIANTISQIVCSSGLEPCHIILEITETAAITETAYSLENLSRLRMRGFGLAVDDYGTGFSSLLQLTRAPFTELKIDQGFVTNCSKDASLRTIIDSNINMARGLSLKTVAEGVESQADLDFLKAVGCDMAQGYFIAKPMDEDMFLEFCRAKHGSEKRKMLTPVEN